MTTLDDLDLMDAQTPATPNGAGSRKHVHVYNKNLPSWVTHGDEEFQSWHLWDCEWNRCEACGPQRSAHVCSCGRVRDEATVRRNRNNARRGKTIQRKRIVGLGGQNLPGNKPNHDGIGLLFSYESKSGGAFSERYWRWLTGIPVTADQTAVLIVTATDGPGRKARSYVVVEYDQWRDLHGEDER